ncbi:kinase-like domain-containing protein [Phialemonium atrogriseum]|uniref:Kinase-like domain-containing protein n=1 Tax=Phialemonium atrogriseum TaxID=1093897 RepID=A0AAJ0BUN0_9PEZI|nr:kinase-like domain-containing protein [Phialemonium atrogriseum]KAK1764566.1 kinase-like domain-containing protein [Phialemonium atrogriseum]
MATASPTPMGAGSHFTALGRRTSARQALRRPPSRQQLSRSDSNPVPLSAAAAASKESKAQSQQYSTLNDSSDDEIPVPMKLSALTKALLNDGHASEASSAPAERPSSPIRATSRMTRRSVLASSTSSNADDRQTQNREVRRHVRAGSAQLPSSRPTSPARSREGSPPPRKRVVRLSASTTTPAGGSLNHRLRRSLSTSTTAHRKRPESRDRSEEKNLQQPQHQHAEKPQTSNQEEPPLDVNTPVLPVRTVRIAVGSSGNKGRSGGSSGISSKRSAGYSDQEVPDDPGTVGRTQPALSQGSVSRYGVRKDDIAPQSSMRVKRVTKLPGSFLSGPARRGKRRQSEEDAEGQGDGEPLVSSQERGSQPPQEIGHDPVDLPASPFLASSYRDFAATGSPVSAKSSARAAIRKQASSANVGEAKAHEPERGHRESPAYKRPAPPPNLPATHDKENEVPSSFRRSKPSSAVLIDADLGKPLQPLKMDIGAAQPPANASPERKALAVKSHNTPHRAAPPPPPKMSVVETATKTAGAAATAQASKKRAILLRVNDRVYTRIECVGRGGSSKVYRVSAENGSMYALKRVSIENADETTVKGFKGEIDLLKRLTGVDRVIQLYDWELNEEKKMLSLLMEIGELDLYTLFKSRVSSEGHKLDLVFVKFFWKEMLECLAAVHAKDIVHSDLKPANFVLVKGRLKLIDFGIANAIQTDETVNVHRENQVGTPNYMSPESLMDSNQYAFTVANNGRFCVPPPMQQQHRKKLMKLGKSSDVWSLGCILYQMVYGDPPFAHISHQMARCQAIINWNHAVEFPDAVGGVRVPPSLVRTMRRCLNREQRERPTCEELLSATDPFLYPQEFDSDVLGTGEGKALPVSEELLGRIIQSVVQRCRERLPTDGEAMSAWPMAYWASIKKTVGAREPRP